MVDKLIIHKLLTLKVNQLKLLIQRRVLLHVLLEAKDERKKKEALL
jgi:hypothetical protein